MNHIAISHCLCAGREDTITLGMGTEHDGGNFGDLLSRYVVEKLSGKRTVKYEGNNVYHLCAIGSLLSRNEMCSNIVVWGSGFLSPQEQQYKVALTKFRQWLRGKTGQPIYLAVRGAKTREIVLRAGYACPAVYADPALLMPCLYSPRVTKKFKLGVVLHWSQEKFTSLFSNLEGVKLIPIHRTYQDITRFIEEALQCEYILSSSLHGLIIADAYKIPCVRLKMAKHPIAASEKKDDFKFEDYLSGLNCCREDKTGAAYAFHTLVLQPGEKLSTLLIDRVISTSTRRDFPVNLTPLVQAFPFLAADYKKCEFKI
ncbi:MAG: polysaccharide pyruvyl transferase family protein [Elusimicrobiaceae bacterium]|nr:polysaccharide pyruvyl transferase family protein [Elusimicrobiaceae bacterium]